MEEEEFMTYTVARHPGALEKRWRHFWEALRSSVSRYTLYTVYILQIRPLF